MALGPIKNPLSALTGSLRGLFDIAGKLREPIGATLGTLGRALERQGANMEAAAIRDQIETQRAIQAAARGAAVTAERGLPDVAMMPEAKTKLRREYSYRVRISHIDSRTGQRVERWVTVSSDDVISKDEAATRAIQDYAGGYGFQLGNVVEVEVTDIRKAGAAGKL